MCGQTNKQTDRKTDRNSAARLIMRQRRRDHMTPVLIALHWLPIRYRILYKVLVLTFQAVHNLAPMYITDLISVYEPGRQLRSASRSLLTVPRHNLEHFGRRGFSVNAPHLWNDLPDNLRLIDSVILFNLLGTKFLGKCMCYHGRVIIEGCRTKCVIDKYTNIFIF